MKMIVVLLLYHTSFIISIFFGKYFHFLPYLTKPKLSAPFDFSSNGALYIAHINYLLISNCWFISFIMDSSSSVMLKSPCMVCLITEDATAKFTMSSGCIFFISA